MHTTVRITSYSLRSINIASSMASYVMQFAPQFLYAIYFIHHKNHFKGCSQPQTVTVFDAGAVRAFANCQRHGYYPCQTRDS